MNGIKEKISSDMINVIDCYQTSRLFKDSQLEKQAEELLDIVLKGLSCEMPIELGNGLLGTACGVIYYSTNM